MLISLIFDFGTNLITKVSISLSRNTGDFIDLSTNICKNPDMKKEIHIFPNHPVYIDTYMSLIQ
ncbi:hypothetical protein [Marinitoga lauensis]|uniref:hypothetical protein n=1 Tax=Marinitoga lauensis TaxID=2201189 RepID=UPI001012CD6C|nr:hypothetical protein [Marinitoga lauensis]